MHSNSKYGNGFQGSKIMVVDCIVMINIIMVLCVVKSW